MCTTPKAVSRPSPSATHAFTLVELLTVVAIIGVLAAILIPTVGTVRRKAASAKSLANLKQFGSAYMAFTGDNKGKLPPAGAVSSGTFNADQIYGVGAHNKGWDYFLLPYLFPNNGHNNLPKNGENLMMHPSDERTNGANQIGARRSYAANSGATPVNAITLLNQINNPSRLILVTERPCGGGTIGDRSFAEVTPALQIRDIPAGFQLNPGNKFNYLFVDGHVESRDLAETLRTGQSASNAAGASYSGTGTFDLWTN